MTDTVPSPDRPRILDLFAGAGGAAMGYHRAGFDVVGVDIEPQPHYPFEFVQADALVYLENNIISSGQRFDAIHASPPCQAYSRAGNNRSGHPDLYEATRDLLEATGLPWVIENVVSKVPYRSGIVLCGSMFGMQVQRHRNFETSFLLMQPQCDHKERPYTITGHAGGKSSRHSRKANSAEGPVIMECPWMTWTECVQAIPPPFTQYIGEALLAHIQSKANSLTPKGPN